MLRLPILVAVVPVKRMARLGLAAQGRAATVERMVLMALAVAVGAHTQPV